MREREYNKVESDAGKRDESSKREHSYLKSLTEKMARARKRFRSDQHEQPEAEDDSSESSTSEVGLPRPQTESENNLKLLLESQNRTFSEPLKAVQRAPNDAVTVVFTEPYHGVQWWITFFPKTV